MNMQQSRRDGWRHGSPKRQGGVSIVLVTVALFMLMAFTALSVDGGNLFVARNELQNASDAGALAGARFLYTNDGSAVNPGANQIAADAAEANDSQNEASEVVSVMRGHWSFGSRTFTPDPSLDPVDLYNKSTAELDVYDPIDPFINAIEVVTAREQTPVEAFFGRVLGFEGYEASARAVGYIGFAGTLRPEDLDQPIALCQQALLDPGGNYSCDVGRFIPENDQTGGWSNLQHGDSGATNANEIRDLVCGDGNPEELQYGEDIETNNGQVQSAFKDFYDCWVEETNQETTWTMTLPVVDCESGIAPNNTLVGAVTIHIVWVVDKENKIDDDAPMEMSLGADSDDAQWPGDWTNASSDGQTRWDDFVGHFDLEGPDGTPADWRQKSIYFLPSCDAHEPKGQTGGENFGVLARIPVLVD